MTMPIWREAEGRGPFHAEGELDARLDRLEGFLHHLMSDLMEALSLLASIREAAEGASSPWSGPADLTPCRGPRPGL